MDILQSLAKMDVRQLIDKEMNERTKGMREELRFFDFIEDLIKEQEKVNKKLEPLLNKEELTPLDKLMISTYDCQLKQLQKALDNCRDIY